MKWSVKRSEKIDRASIHTISKGKHYTGAGKATFNTHAQHGMSHKTIAEATNRDGSTVIKLLDGLTRKKQDGKVGRLAILLHRDKRYIGCQTVVQKHSENAIQSSSQLSVCIRRVQQVLKTTQHVAFIKNIPSTKLTEEHEKMVLVWERSKIHWDYSMWKSMIFTDEKNFNWNGPDGLQ